MLVTGSADNTMKLWKVQTGECLYTWEFSTAVKRVNFSEDDSKVLAVTEQRMGHMGTIEIFEINRDGPREFSIIGILVLVLIIRLQKPSKI